MSEITRNRTLPGELSWLLRVAEGLEGGRIELTPIRSPRGASKVRASLLHDEGTGLMGIGKSATDAAKALRDAVELHVAHARAEGDRAEG